MTKQEFIQEAALRLIGAARYSEITYIEIADAARCLADEIYGTDDEQEPENHTGVPSNEPISNLIREIDRIDMEEKLRLKEEYKVKYPHWNYKPKNSGYAERVRKQCIVLGFKYVQNLIDYSRVEFRKQHTMGEKTVGKVDKALLNLYNITVW